MYWMVIFKGDKMRFLIFAILIHGCGAHAANWFPVGKQGAATTYTQESACETQEAAECFEISGKDLRFHVLQSTEVDDLSKPIYKTKYEITSCDTPEECVQIVATLQSENQCDDAPNDFAAYEENALLPGYSAYCTGIEGYEQKTATDLVLDAGLQTTVLAADSAAAANDGAVKQVMVKMACGKVVQAQMALRNVTKGLTPTQVKDFMEQFATIKSLLDAGAMVTAKAEVEAITPDGTLTTADDKTAMVAEINKCL